MIRNEAKNQGFTLIEILVVMALIAALIGISVPAISSISRAKAGSELGKFNVFVKKMFMKSIRKSEYIRIVVDFKTGEYWAERTETPFFVMSADEAKEYKEKHQKLLEAAEDDASSTSLFSKNTGAGVGANNLFEMMKAKNDTEDQSDFYNWENFVPEKKNIKELIKPSYEAVEKKFKIPSSLMWTKFFSYQTPEIITQETESENEPLRAEIYIFPQGRIEPFYLAIGNSEGETIFYLTSDFFLTTKINRGDFSDEVKQLQEDTSFKEGDEEGK